MLKCWNLKKQETLHKMDHESTSWEQADIVGGSFVVRFFSPYDLCGQQQGFSPLDPKSLGTLKSLMALIRRAQRIGLDGDKSLARSNLPSRSKALKATQRKIAMGLPSSIIVSIHPSSTNNNNHAIWPFSFLSSALITLLDNGYKVLVVKLIYPQLYTIIMKDHKIAVLYCK